MRARQFDRQADKTPEEEQTLSTSAGAARIGRGQGILSALLPPAQMAATLRRTTGGQIARAGQSLLQLQRRHGNHYVQRVVQQMQRPRANPNAAPAIQRQMQVGPAGDRYEHEADRVAEQVLAQSGNPLPAAHAPQLRLQRNGLTTAATVEPTVETEIRAAQGSGQPLPAGVHMAMGHALGADFGAVRVHNNQRADRLNQALQARAFTTGRDIFFRRGEYNPAGAAGQRLLAHELTHVVQQSGARLQTGAIKRQQVIQLARVTRVQGNVPRQWLVELQRIVQAAEDSGGQSTFTFQTNRFANAIGPANRQDTFAVGGQLTERVLPDGGRLRLIGPTVSIGSRPYHQSIGADAHLGRRSSGLHAEMLPINRGVEGINWIYATQDNCLFCHGYLHSRGIQHQELRDPNPWPQQWRHPEGMFTLAQGSPAVGNAIEIEFGGQRRSYQIS